MKRIKNYIILLLAFLLLCSIVVNLIQMREPSPLPIVGTFLHADQGFAGLYLVFEHDGSFAKYRQFEVPERGTYIPAGAGIYTLQSRAGDFITQVLYRGEHIYMLTPDGKIMVFLRIDTVPTFINVRPR